MFSSEEEIKEFKKIQRLFAHIHLDMNLQGSWLQGGDFNQFINYFNEFVGYFNEFLAENNSELESTYDFSHETINRLNSLKEDFKRLDKYSACIRALIIDSEEKDSTEKKEKKFKYFCEQVSSDINDLKPGNHLFIPGGWNSLAGRGHAIVYEIRRLTDREGGGFLFLVYNSGAGLEKHHQQTLRITEEQSVKYIYESVISYHVPLGDEFNLQAWSEFIKKILEPQIYPWWYGKGYNGEDYIYDASTVYQTFNYLHHLDGKQVDPKKYLDFVPETAGQISGTCPLKSLNQIIKTVLYNKKNNNLKDYFIFKDRLKQSILDKYVSVIERLNKFQEKNNTDLEWQTIENKSSESDEEEYEDPYKEENRLINGALPHVLEGIENMGRLLEKEILSSGKAPGNLIIKQIESLSKLHKDFTNRYKQSLKKPLENKNLEEQDFSTNLTLNFYKEMSEPTAENLIFSEKTSDEFSSIKFKLKGNIWFSLQDISKTVEQYINQGAYPKACEYLEKGLLSFPLPTTVNEILDFYSGIDNQEQLDQVMSSLKDLVKNYVLCLKKTQGDSTVSPRMIVVNLTIMAIVCYLVEELKCRLDVKGQNSFNYGFGRILASSVLPILERTNRNPFLRTMNYQCDKQLITLRKFFKKRDAGYINQSDYVNYYSRVLDKFPKIKKQLTFDYHSELNNIDKDIIAFLKKNEEIQQLFILFHPRLDQEKKEAYQAVYEYFNTQEKIEFVFFSAFGNFFLHSTTSSLSNNFYNYFEISVHKIWGEYDAELKPFRLFGDFKDKSFEREILEYYEVNNEALNNFPLISDSDSDRINFEYAGKEKTNLAQVALSNRQNYPRMDDNPELSSSDFFRLQQLFQVRISPSLQGLSTIHFFGEEPQLNKFTNEEIQLNLESNIFEPEALNHLLNRRDEVVGEVTAFLTKGFRHYLGNSLPSKESLFFLRLLYFFHHYVLDFSKENKRNQLLKNTTKELLQLKETLCDISKREMDSSLKVEFYKYYFLILQLNNRCTKENDETLLEDSLKALLFINSRSEASAKKDIDGFNLINVQLYNVIELANKPDLRGKIPEILNRFFKDLNLDPVDDWLDNHPIYRDGNDPCFYVDLRDMLIIDGEYAYSKLPMHIALSEVLKKGITSSIAHVFIHNSKSHWKIKCENGEIFRVFCIQGRDDYGHVEEKLILQKWIKDPIDSSSGAWYEWYSINSNQKMLSKHFEFYLPHILEERGKQVWFNSDNKRFVIFDSETGKNIYYYQDSVMKAFDSNSCLINYCWVDTDSWLHELFSDFESSQFIEITYNKGEKKYHIVFPRYNLKLIAKGDSPSNIKVTTEDGCYELIFKNRPQLVKNFSSPLLFKSGNYRKALLPQQQFIPKRKNHHELIESPSGYYQLTLDKESEIQDKTTKKDGSMFDPDFCFRYSDQEESLWYDVDEDEKLVSNSVLKSLYLTYVYLCHHQPDAALEELDKCKQYGFTNDPKAIELIEWIVNAVPRVPNKEDFVTLEETTIHSGTYLSVKLTALSLLVEAQHRGEVVNWPDVENEKNDNDIYHNARVKSVKDFYGSLPEKIHELFEKYLRVSNNLSYDFELKTDNEFLLLNNIVSNKKKLFFVSNIVMNRYEEFKRIHLNEKNEEIFKFKEKKFSEESYYFKLTPYFTLNEKFLSRDIRYQAFKILLDPESKKNSHDAMSELSLEMSEDCFLNNFHCYYEIMQNRSSLYQEKLYAFCLKAIKTEFLYKGKKSNRFQLCSLLYFVGKNSGRLHQDCFNLINRKDYNEEGYDGKSRFFNQWKAERALNTVFSEIHQISQELKIDVLTLQFKENTKKYVPLLKNSFEEEKNRFKQFPSKERNIKNPIQEIISEIPSLERGLNNFHMSSEKLEKSKNQRIRDCRSKKL